MNPILVSMSDPNGTYVRGDSDADPDSDPDTLFDYCILVVLRQTLNGVLPGENLLLSSC